MRERLLKILKSNCALYQIAGSVTVALRYLCQDANVSGRLTEAKLDPEVIFNYLEQLDRSVDESSPFRLASESAGQTRSPLDTRLHLIEISGSVIGGELHLSWIYSKNIHAPSTIEKLAGEFLKALRSLIAHCLTPQASGYTPSDFPKVRISQKELDELVAKGGAAGTLVPKGLIEDIYPLSPYGTRACRFTQFMRPRRECSSFRCAARWLET